METRYNPSAEIEKMKQKKSSVEFHTTFAFHRPSCLFVTVLCTLETFSECPL